MPFGTTAILPVSAGSQAANVFIDFDQVRIPQCISQFLAEEWVALCLALYQAGDLLREIIYIQALANQLDNLCTGQRR